MDHVLNTCVGNRLSVAALVAGREEELHVEDAVRRLDVLVGDGAADCGFVYSDYIGDLSHCAGPQLGDAFFEEIGLDLHDLVGDAFDRLLALLDGADEEFAGTHFLLNVFLLFSRQLAPGDHLFIRVADSQARDVVTVQGDLPFVFVVFDYDVG